MNNPLTDDQAIAVTGINDEALVPFFNISCQSLRTNDYPK